MLYPQQPTCADNDAYFILSKKKLHTTALYTFTSGLVLKLLTFLNTASTGVPFQQAVCWLLSTACFYQKAALHVTLPVYVQYLLLYA